MRDGKTTPTTSPIPKNLNSRVKGHATSQTTEEPSASRCGCNSRRRRRKGVEEDESGRWSVIYFNIFSSFIATV